MSKGELKIHKMCLELQEMLPFRSTFQNVHGGAELIYNPLNGRGTYHPYSFITASRFKNVK